MKNTLISIILINKSEIFPFKIIENIKSQSHTNFEIFIFSSQNNFISNDKFFNIKIFELKKFNNIYSQLKQTLKFITGKFLSILNDEDEFSTNRFELQLKEIKNNDVISCLSFPINAKDVIISKDMNQFCTEKEIDFAIKSGYIPLDLYTFLYKTSFLKNLLPFMSDYQKSNELDIVLLTLRYSKIKKTNCILHYFKTSKTPYKENINLDLSINTQNPIGLFIRNNYIKNRSFLKSNLNTNLNTKKIFKYNILILLETPCIGGTETYLLSICKKLRKYSIDTIFLTYNGIFDDILIKNNFTVVNYSLLYSEFRKKNYPTCINILNNLKSKYNLSLVYLHTPFELEIYHHFKKNLNLPLLMTIHGTYYKKHLLIDSNPSIDKFIFVSKGTKDFYNTSIKNIDVKSFVINNGIEPIKTNITFKKSKYKNTKIPKVSKKILLYCSRMSYNKSKTALHFLAEFEKLLKYDSNIIAFIAGDGTHYNDILRQANRINFIYGKKIFLFGFINNLNKYYKISYLVIGTGRVAIEGLSNKKTVLALGLAGFYGVLTPYNTASLIDSNFADHKINIKSKNLYPYLKLLIQNKKLNKYLGSFGYKYYLNNLNISKIGTKVKNVIINLIK